MALSWSEGRITRAAAATVASENTYAVVLPGSSDASEAGSAERLSNVILGEAPQAPR